MSNVWFRSGIFLPPHHSNEEDPTLCIQRDFQLVEWLDRLGYEEAWIGEHHSGGFETISSPEVFIAAAAERTKRIRLGTGVVSLPYHNPLTVAGRIIQLDHQTMGRVMFGVGPGALYLDAKMMGIDTDTSRGRLAESLEVIMALFRGETVTKKTDWFTLNEAALAIKPFTHPSPEVVIASTQTPSGARLAGKFGAGLICIAAAEVGGYDALAENWKIANEIAAENNQVVERKNLRLVAPMHLAETREQARANCRFGLEKWLEFGFLTNPGRVGAAEAKSMDPVDLAIKARGATIGTPDDAIALIKRLQAKQGDFGCLLHFGHNWADWEQTKRSYELYARYVVPHIRQSNMPRAASLDRYRSMGDEIRKARGSAVANTFTRFNAEREAQGKAKIKAPETSVSQNAPT